MLGEWRSKQLQLLKESNSVDSIAVNGCCLTVVAILGSKLSFDLLEESIQKTNFDQLP